jgi:hypothetical protein
MGVTMYLAEDGVLPYSWSGRYWPEAAGWQTVSRLQGDTSSWYAWRAGAWRALYRERRKEETETFIKGMTGNRALAMGSRVPGTDGGVAGWLYALLIVSLLFLWIEKKIL